MLEQEVINNSNWPRDSHFSFFLHCLGFFFYFSSTYDYWHISCLSGISEKPKVSSWRSMTPLRAQCTSLNWKATDFKSSSWLTSSLPKDGQRNVLITSALPCKSLLHVLGILEGGEMWMTWRVLDVNNVPHLGNIIGWAAIQLQTMQVLVAYRYSSTLSADVFARYNRTLNVPTLYVSLRLCHVIHSISNMYCRFAEPTSMEPLRRRRYSFESLISLSP